MRVQIQNIGAIDMADINLEGITIIAGENNVGKSTVGKALYAFLHDMCNWKQTYENLCSDRIATYLYRKSIFLEDLCMQESGAKRRRTSKVDLLQSKYAANENFIAALEDYQITEGEEEAAKNVEFFLKEYCREYISLYIKNDVSEFCDKHYELLQQWLTRIMEGIDGIELDERELQTQNIKSSFQNIFNYQYRKIGTTSSCIRMTNDEGRTVEMQFSTEQEELSAPVRLEQRIFFIESPKIYDFLSDARYGHIQKEYLRYLMSPNVFRKAEKYPAISKEEDFPEAGESGKVLQRISEELQEVMGGRAEFLQKVGLEFKDSNIPEDIHSINVSTGLKSMALLEYALRIGAIQRGDILVLDEPEINLHPDWQVEYARTLVELQKHFELKILITTHSPYFMRAIECYTDVAGVMDTLNVYRMTKEKSTGMIAVENVSYSEYGITSLYEELSSPLEELEKILDENEE